MADLGLRVHVREHKDDGTPEKTWPDIPRPRVSGVFGKKTGNDQLAPVIVGDEHGVAVIDAFKVRVEADGFSPYEGVFEHPSLEGDAELPVSLRRL